jgi:hypothetical protein
LQNVQKTHHYQLYQKAIEIAKELLRNTTTGRVSSALAESDDLLADALLDDWLELENEDDFDSEDQDVDRAEDYFEDYFEDYVDSLNDPQNPHLEP